MSATSRAWSCNPGQAKLHKLVVETARAAVAADMRAMCVLYENASHASGVP